MRGPGSDESDDDNEDEEGKSNNKYQFRLGIIESFWEMKSNVCPFVPVGAGVCQVSVTLWEW